MLRCMQTLVLAVVAVSLGCSERPGPRGASGEPQGRRGQPDRNDLYAAVVRWRLDQPWGEVRRDYSLFVTLDKQDPDEAFFRRFPASEVPVKPGSQFDGVKPDWPSKGGLLLRLDGVEELGSGAVVVKGCVAGSGPNEHPEFCRWRLGREAGQWVVVQADWQPPGS
jgi:hypothetical protein